MIHGTQRKANTDWFRNAIIYHIFIDRFAEYSSNDPGKPEFIGGSIKGITGKLDYLSDLGITCLWLSPFYKTSAYHGYHITDFLQVDPRFGTTEDLRDLIDGVHKRGMQIIGDFVPNHCSHMHPFFLDAVNSRSSPYFPWFYFTRWPDEYLCFLRYRELPKLNLDCAAAHNHLIEAALYWLRFGLDGYRIDHVLGPRNSFWLSLKANVKAEFPGAVLIGEAWMHGVKFSELKTIGAERKFFKWLFQSSETIYRDYIGIFDGVLDFRFQKLVSKLILRKNSAKTKRSLLAKIERHFAGWPEDFFLPTFLDNHDMERFLFRCKGDKEKLKEAAKLQFSIDQPAIIYYGTEAGMSQPQAFKDFKTHGDLMARQPMKWKEQDPEMLAFYKALIREKRGKVVDTPRRENGTK